LFLKYCEQKTEYIWVPDNTCLIQPGWIKVLLTRLLQLEPVNGIVIFLNEKKILLLHYMNQWFFCLLPLSLSTFFYLTLFQSMFLLFKVLS
jgi:hypothetical protein